MDAPAGQPLLARHSQLPPARPGGDEHGPRRVLVALLRRHAQPLAVPRDATDGHRLKYLDAVLARLGDHAVGDLDSRHSSREPGVVVVALHPSWLAAGRALLDNQAVDPLAGGVDGGGEARRPPTDDDQVVRVLLRFQPEAQLAGELIV